MTPSASSMDILKSSFVAVTSSQDISSFMLVFVVVRFLSSRFPFVGNPLESLLDIFRGSFMDHGCISRRLVVICASSTSHKSAALAGSRVS